MPTGAVFYVGFRSYLTIEAGSRALGRSEVPDSVFLIKRRYNLLREFPCVLIVPGFSENCRGTPSPDRSSHESIQQRPNRFGANEK